MKTFKFIIILRFECDCDNHANGFIMQSKVCSAGPIISLPLYLNASCVACHSQFSPRIVCGFFLSSSISVVINRVYHRLTQWKWPKAQFISFALETKPQRLVGKFNTLTHWVWLGVFYFAQVLFIHIFCVPFEIIIYHEKNVEKTTNIWNVIQ